ncbi:hypothetical protein VXS04_03675 [Photobacterium piscicola]|uniref:hypothetical protein n=1 Tax=Photobacterium piscicola TaxID=1378299 RepID=UPI002E17E864|nr:hypothetical protein [Photobacterium piscicola]
MLNVLQKDQKISYALNGLQAKGASMPHTEMIIPSSFGLISRISLTASLFLVVGLSIM